MQRLREQEETSKKLKREMKLQQEEQKALRSKAVMEAEDQRLREVQMQYAGKEREMQDKIDRFRRQFEEEQIQLKKKQDMDLAVEREKLEKERRRIEQVSREISVSVFPGVTGVFLQ